MLSDLNSNNNDDLHVLLYIRYEALCYRRTHYLFVAVSSSDLYDGLIGFHGFTLAGSKVYRE